jgi:hypothetical protein
VTAPLTLTRRQCKIINHYLTCLSTHYKCRFLRSVEDRLTRLPSVDDQSVSDACAMALQSSDAEPDPCLECGDAA